MLTAAMSIEKGSVMSEIKQNSAKAVVRRMLRFTLIVAAIGFCLKAAVLHPIYTRFASDVAFRDAWWVLVLYYLTEGGLCDLVVFGLCYPASLYAVWSAGLKGAASVPAAFAGLTVFKFLLNFVVSAITDSALPQFSNFFLYDFLPIILPMILLELLQYALMLAVIAFWRNRYQNRLLLSEAAAELGRNIPAPAPVFPFTRLVSIKNPIQGTALLSALVLLIGRVAMHQIYQYAQFINSGYTEGLLIMVVDLLSDIFISVLFYFAYLILIPRFHEKATAA